MTAVELDPLFVRALKLLQSKSKDAADQLKQMHDDVIALRKFGVQEKKTEDFKEISRSVDRSSHKKEVEFLKFGETEKRSHDNLKHDSTEAIQVKKLKLEFGYSTTKSSESNRSGRELEKEQEHAPHKEQSSEKMKDRVKIKLGKGRENEREEKMKKEEVRKAVISSSSEEEDDSDTEEDSPSPLKNALKIDTEFGLDMDDIACVVCKQFNVTSVNRLVECQECHSLYHQECHRPPVTSKNVSDPRYVWYCSRCSKNLKKMVSKPLKPKPTPFPFTKDPGQTSKTKPDHFLQQAFRRVDTTKSSLLKDSAARPVKGLQGMASLAANLSGKQLGSDSNKHPKAESKFLVSTAKADTVKPSQSGKSDASKFTMSAFSRLDAPKNPSSISAKLDATKPRSGEPAKVAKSLISSSTGRMSQSSMMSADKRVSMMKKKAQKKINDRKSSLK